MKTIIILIIGLFMISFIAPAMADSIFEMDQTYSENRAVTVNFEKAVGYDTVTSDPLQHFSPFNYPPDKYEYIALYYSLYNPTDTDVSYEFNVTVQDQAGNVFTTDEFVLPDLVPAHKSVERTKEFAVYRNSTNLKFVWTDKQPNPPWSHYDIDIDIRFTPQTQETVSPTATSAAAATATPTATATATGSSGGCLPFLPLGIILGGVGCLGILTGKYRIRR